MPDDAPAPEIRDDAERSRYELLLGDEVAAVADYRREGDRSPSPTPGPSRGCAAAASPGS